MRKIHRIVEIFHKCSPNCQEAALCKRDSTALEQAQAISTTTAQAQRLWRSCLALLALPSQARQSKPNWLCCRRAVQGCQFQTKIYCFSGVLCSWQVSLHKGSWHCKHYEFCHFSIFCVKKFDNISTEKSLHQVTFYSLVRVT